MSYKLRLEFPKCLWTLGAEILMNFNGTCAPNFLRLLKYHSKYILLKGRGNACFIQSLG